MFTEMAKELEMPWRAVEAMHWELGAEGIAARTGQAAFVPVSTNSEGPPPPSFAVQGAKGQHYAVYPQGHLPPPYVAVSGPPHPAHFQQAWPSPQYRVPEVNGHQQGYWTQTPSYEIQPQPTQSNLDVPRTRRSSSTASSSSRNRGPSKSRRSTLDPEMPAHGSMARSNLQTMQHEYSRHLPPPKPDQIGFRQEIAPPQLPSFTAVEAATRGYYPSPPGGPSLPTPLLKEPPPRDTPPISEPRPSVSPQPVGQEVEAPDGIANKPASDTSRTPRSTPAEATNTVPSNGVRETVESDIPRTTITPNSGDGRGVPPQ